MLTVTSVEFFWLVVLFQRTDRFLNTLICFERKSVEMIRRLTDKIRYTNNKRTRSLNKKNMECVDVEVGVTEEVHRNDRETNFDF
jgi:hypothetical protein